MKGVKTVSDIGAMIKFRYRFMVEANQDWGKAVGSRRQFTNTHGYTAIREDAELMEQYEELGYQVGKANEKISRLAGEINTLWEVLGVKRSVY